MKTTTIKMIPSAVRSILFSTAILCLFVSTADAFPVAEKFNLQCVSEAGAHAAIAFDTGLGSITTSGIDSLNDARFALSSVDDSSGTYTRSPMAGNIVIIQIEIPTNLSMYSGKVGVVKSLTSEPGAKKVNWNCQQFTPMEG